MFKVAATFGVSFATASRVAAIIFSAAAGSTGASMLKATLLASVGFIGAGIAVMAIGLGLAWLVSRYNTRYKMSNW